MLDMLKKLCSADGVSGDEELACQAATELLSPLGEVSRTALGCVICRIAPKRANLPKVMLTAHIDQIGLVVTKITDKGFLKVAACGGPDHRSFAGARVTVHTKSGKIPGVICAVPPHLSNGKSTPKKPVDSAVDIGMSAEAAKQKVAPGDRITFDGAITPMLSDRICGASLDDRCGCAAVIRAAKQLADCDTAEISVALVTQEEVGSAGASTAANLLAPDFCFAVDVSMGFTPDDRPEECGEMGKGPMIGVAPILDRRLATLLRDTANRLNIPWQHEVMGGKTGTDADYIAISGKGVRTALVSIPLRFMHTANEIIALCDMENTAKLISQTIGGGLDV